VSSIDITERGMILEDEDIDAVILSHEFLSSKP
jgi:hypothetical protein